MSGSDVFRTVEYGTETTHGTAVAADTKLLCSVTPTDGDRQIIIPSLGTGQRIAGTLDSAYVRRIMADGLTMEFPADEAGLYFQALPFLLNCGVKADVGAEQTGGEGDYLYEHAAPLTGAETVDTITLEAGDDSQAYEWDYCLLRQLVIAGNADTGEVTATATWTGTERTATTFTGSSIPTTTPMIGKLMRLYIDDSWVTLGTTEVEDALLDWTITLDTGVHPKMRGSATRLYEAHGQDRMMLTIELALERVAAVDTEHDYFLADTPTTRHVRLELDSGVAIGAGENHQFWLDAAGVWTAWTPMGRNQDGNLLDVVTFTCGYDATGSSAFQFNTITNITTP
jgi:hypothetical protein